MAKKNILIVDDSALMRRVISDIINADERFEVLETANNGQEGLDKIIANPRKYDAIVLDINMPKLNGLEVLEQLQKNHIRIKVIVVSTVAKEGAKETIIALERGAFDFVTKPDNLMQVRGEDFKQSLMSVLSVATGVEDAAFGQSILGSRLPGGRKSKLDEQRKRSGGSEDLHTSSAKTSHTQTGSSPRAFELYGHRESFKPHKRFMGKKDGKRKLIALASSTGGPKSLQSVIPKLPANIDAPMIIVQHMPKGFTKSLAMRLDEMSKVHVKEAEDGDILKKGWVYVAPGGKQMKVLKSGQESKVCLTDDPPIGGLRPCANIMYESLIGSSYDEITCVVLTGMGADGTNGIGSLGENANIYVVAQDEETSVVYGMPKAVAVAGLVDEVKPLDRVADAIIKNVGVLNDGR